MSSTRDDIQKEAFSIAIQNKRVGLAISMGVGKTLIGLKYIDHFRKDNNPKVLVVAPKLSIFESWKDDGIKFGISGANVDFTTYLSLNKNNPKNYDIVILDECHSLLYSHELFLSKFTGRILGLTGTPPRYNKSEKGEMVQKYCKISYKYVTDDAVEEGILNDYRIIVHKLSLSTKNNITINTKSKSFTTSELKNYIYLTQQVDNSYGKRKQMTSIMRMRGLMNFKTKEKYAIKLTSEIEDKCLLFCNSKEQADRMSKHSVYSGNPDSDENLQKFKNDEIDLLACIHQLSEGVNIPNLRCSVIMHSYANERKFSQKLGRTLRLNPDEMATIHILCYKNTIDEQWVEEALKDFDAKKIKYFDINEE
jgi:superfamily II DNA or RNA helicase